MHRLQKEQRMKRTPREVLDHFPSALDGGQAPKALSEIIIGCTEETIASINELRESLKNGADANNKLAARLFWLNVILTAATVVGAIAALLSFVARKIRPWRRCRFIATSFNIVPSALPLSVAWHLSGRLAG
jgi:hypothetical protein